MSINLHLILSILSRDIVSTISSESCPTSRVIEERRRRLLPNMVEMLTCVKDGELENARIQHEVQKGVQ